MNKKKLGIIICAHDGISSIYGGVGAATDAYFESIAQLQRELHAEYEIRAWAITPRIADSNAGFSRAQLQKIRHICQETGGDVLECCHVSDGVDQYGDARNWAVTSPTAALLAYQVLKEYKPDDAVVIAECTPFAKTPTILRRHVDFDINLHAVWLPHSTTLIEERGRYSTARLNFELNAVRSINAAPGLFVGYIGSYMRDHLERDYGVQPTKLTPMLNGIAEKAVPVYPQDEIRSALLQRSIPVDKSIIFSFGRGMPYKGFDIFMRAARELDELDCHFVLQAAVPSMDFPIVADLKELQNPNITLLFDLDFALPRQLMQWDKTELVAVLSRVDAQSLVPMEVRSYGKALILVSNRDGLPQQVHDGQDGFVTDLQVDEVARTMREILRLPRARKAEIAAAGARLVQEKYDISKNFTAAIVQLLGSGAAAHRPTGGQAGSAT
ncbi:glycosyltransferase family 4 protein [Streptomyces sp. N2A]|uniref:glycosyltransferase family 4 protein n=1 Tax=Streptomyces sp. N2A TaxID=3073936 RepID=UPI00286FF5F4|nr:glycosyltransferase family 4 protein [Streptomyces sp. N2A]